VEYLRIGETGFAFILNKIGQFQTNPVASVKPDELIAHFKDMNLTDRSQLISRKKTQDGQEILYAIRSLKEGDWIMVLQQDAKDAFADLRNAQRIALLIILIGSLGIIATSLVVSQRLIRRISKADEGKEIADKEKDIMSQQDTWILFPWDTESQFVKPIVSNT
jgi:two-component system NtrC family sensor kinase